MKVLFATHDQADYLASCLWDGLRDVLGGNNVFDAGNNEFFHLPYDPKAPNSSNHNVCSGSHGHFAYHMRDERDFDLLVLNACFRAQYGDWHWPWQLRDRLRSGGKIVYVEGADCAGDINDPMSQSNPPFPVDVVFRRELDPGIAYPYHAQHLTFAAPVRWVRQTLDHPQPRLIDVYYSGYPYSHPLRREMFHHLFHMPSPYNFVFAQQAVQGWSHILTTEEHFSYLRRSKLALCPLGGCGCLFTMRLFEILACGAIPVFVGWAPRVIDPPLSDEAMNICFRSEELPLLISALLAQDLESRHHNMMAHVLKHHTTRARALRLLRAIGV